ncbi:methylated-DNA--[protein]-cysteine S-methyltransferase [Paraperlucidibaca sp.]|jgi:AraC family transcriptional regulator of adaptative response/methylated-DNA-[protein]-cysteine methyltransferase|uniref:methylated-DNA--[protein]-cysteine S-methyltransferase n=1 Tax=Paraperlucidibaca sp. TaxID=2708021 RepID=UPI0030F438B7|tara:strand:- start:1319 stop:1861 length:543 start_codon:yes stop_codon:yes gene_type:complete
MSQKSPQFKTDTTLLYHCFDGAAGRLLIAVGHNGLASVIIGEDDEELVAGLISEHPKAQCAPMNAEQQREHAATAKAIEAMSQGQAANVALPMALPGTEFQQAVWQALCRIPRGQTISYKALADAVGRPRAIRAAASACGANPLALIVPCHRVIASDGGMGGYKWGVAHKVELLRREQLD